MNSKLRTQTYPRAKAAWTRSCLTSCWKALQQISAAKQAVFAEFAQAMQPHRHLLHLALNEAESLAWQTQYPHLVFANLAKEKAQGVLEWERKQQTLRSREAAAAHAA